MDIRATRKTNFDALIKEAGSIASLARRAGASEKYLRHIFNGFQGPKDKTPRQVGDDLARKLEEGTGKPHGWMDQPHDNELPVEFQTLLNTITDAARTGGMTPEQAAAFDTLIKTSTGTK